MSGFSGIESVPGPELPQFDFLNRFNGLITQLVCVITNRLCIQFLLDIINWVEPAFAEENQKKYAENDARFKESPLLKKLLEKSKLNKAK